MDNLGRIVGPLLATFMYSANIHLPFVVTACITLLSVMLLFAFVTHEKKWAPYSSQL